MAAELGVSGFMAIVCVIGRYSLAVTRHKDWEQTSNSMYIQSDPWDPAINFENFLRNNEDIENKVSAPPTLWGLYGLEPHRGM